MFANPAGEAYRQRILEEAEARQQAEAAAEAARREELGRQFDEQAAQIGLNAYKSEKEKEIAQQHLAQWSEDLLAERAKNETQLTEEKLNREILDLSGQLAELYKNYSRNRPQIEALEAKHQATISQLDQIQASKPYEPSNAVKNFYSASANSHSTGGRR